MDLIERPAEALADSRRHPWEVARARVLLRLLQQLGLTETTRTWLDVGAGDAWFARQLRSVVPQGAEIVCWDNSYSQEQLASMPEVDGSISMTVERPPGSFGGVLMLDVIEHVADDVGFVRETVEGSVAPEGWVFVTVPAYQALFSDHDRALKHHRRYSPRSIRTVLESAGLTVTARGALFHSLLPIRGAQVLKERISNRSRVQQGIGAWHGEESLSRALVRGLELEGRLSVALGKRGLPSPPGLSNWAFCRRFGEAGS